LSKIVATVTS